MKIKKTYIKLIILFALTLSSKAHAVCDFKTSEYIDELESPKSIKSIKIDIPKLLLSSIPSAFEFRTILVSNILTKGQ